MNPASWQRWHGTIGYGLPQWSPNVYYMNYLVYLGYLDKETAGTAEGADKVDDLARDNPLLLMNSQLEFLVETLKKDENRESAAVYMWGKVSEYGGIEAEQFCKSDHDIGELALVFEASYERSGRGRKERVRSAYKWGIYFGEVTMEEAEEAFRERYGGTLWED